MNRVTFATAVLCASLLATAPARAEPRPDEPEGAARPAPLRISAVGDCPSPDAVTATIESLIPQHVADVSRRNPEVAITDQGDSYKVRVVAEGVPHLRVYRDVGRDCAHRARVAAVFVVLTLLPPEVMMESPPAPPPPPVAPPPPVVLAPAPPPQVPGPSWRLSVGLAGVIDVAPAVLDAPSIVSPGAELRMALQKGRLAGELGFGAQPSAAFSLAGVSAQERRIPIDVSLAFRQPVRAFELGAAAGIAGAVFEAEGVNLAMRGGGTRVDLGARAAVEIRIASASRRLAGFIGAHALYFPRQYELGTMPGGVVGHTPSLWIGGRLGAAVSF